MGNITYIGVNPKPVSEMLYDLWNPPPIVGVDTECPDLVDKTLIGLAIATSEFDSYWFPANSTQMDLAMRILCNPNVTKVFHNAKFDFEVLAPYGIDESNFEDSEILAYTLNYPLKLYNLCATLRISVPDEYMFWEMPSGKKMTDLPIEFVRGKCGFDARGTLICWKRLLPKIAPAYFIDRNCVHILRRMEKKGVAIDQNILTEFDYLVGDEMDERRAEFEDKYGCSPASNKQVAELLRQKGYNIPLTASRKNYRVDEKVLIWVRDKFQEPIATDVLKFREVQKQFTTYIRPFRGVERVFPKFHNTRVVTGRLSSSDPNAQNIPEHLRSIFRADSRFFSLDASQIELRTVAWIAQDKVLLEAFERGEDIHARTMRELGFTPSPDARKVAKVINFAVLFGGEENVVVDEAYKQGIKLTMGEARGMIQMYFQRMAGVAEWIRAMRYQIMETGKVQTMHGRIRSVPLDVLRMNDMTREKAMRELINMPIQGSAVEVVKLGMHTTRDFDLRIQVHDELLFDGACPPPDRFFGLSPFHVPFNLKTGTNWGHLVKVNGYM